MKPQGRTIPRTRHPGVVRREYQGIPLEVWLQVFPHLLLDIKDVKNITLTSTSFRLLAQPLLFHHIHFRPISVISPTSGHLMTWLSDLERITERLEFFTLERIGHGVQDVDIFPHISYGRREEGTVDLGVIVDAIFRSLVRFPHLRGLKCVQIVFSVSQLSQLPGLLSFETFTAVNCHIAGQLAERNTPIVAVKDLNVMYGSMAPDTNHSSYQYWLSLMHPEFLSGLSLLPLSSHLHRMLAEMAAHGAIYRSLRSFKCSWYAVESPYFLEVLAQFPFLVELRLPVLPNHRGITLPTPLPDYLVPNLKILEAPDRTIPLFVQNRRVRELSLGTTSELGSDPEDLISALNQLSPTAALALEKISVYVTKFTQELCNALDTRFPGLKSLTILGNGVVWGPNPGGLGAHSIKTIVAMFLSLQLPSSLEYLCIGEEYKFRPNSWDVRVDGEDVLLLKSHFLMNNPTLQEVHFYSASVELDWFKGKLVVATRPQRKFLDLQPDLFSSSKVRQQRRLSLQN